MMRTWPIPERRAVEGAIREMAMTMTTARVRRTRRAVRTRLGKGREQRMERGMGRRLKTGGGKGRGMGRETVKGTVLMNKPQEEMILSCHCFAVAEGDVRGRLGHGGLTKADTFRAGSITCRVNFLR